MQQLGSEAIRGAVRECAHSQGWTERATLTVEEIAAYLGISRSLAFDLVRQGKIPSIRLGRRIVIPKTALAYWLEGQVRHE